MSPSPLRLLLTRRLTALIPCWLALAIPSACSAGLITLQNATATFSQTGFTPNETIDGITLSNNGWAISPQVGTSHTTVWETAVNQGSGNDLITFTLIQNQGNFHTLLRFRLSYTTDDRSLFANGVATGGDVTANWTVIDLASFSGTGAPTMTEQGDLSILVSGNNPATLTYTASYNTNVVGITGFRLEAMEATPGGAGPGRQANGNFVLTEFQVDITPQSVNPVPEPASFAFLGSGLLGLIGVRRRKQR